MVEEAGFPGFTSTVIGVCGFKGVRLAWVWGLGFRVKFFFVVASAGIGIQVRLAHGMSLCLQKESCMVYLDVHG